MLATRLNPILNVSSIQEKWQAGTSRPTHNGESFDGSDSERPALVSAERYPDEG